MSSQPVHPILSRKDALVVVSVLMDSEAIISGITVAAKLRYTRVWHSRDGAWKVIAGHMSQAEEVA